MKPMKNLLLMGLLSALGAGGALAAERSHFTHFITRDGATLKDGDKVKVSVRFRGREVTHASLGQDLLHRFAELCAECSTVEKQPKLEGRQMLMFLAPAKDK